jgi:hypothetical protein
MDKKSARTKDVCMLTAKNRVGFAYTSVAALFRANEADVEGDYTYHEFPLQRAAPRGQEDAKEPAAEAAADGDEPMILRIRAAPCSQDQLGSRMMAEAFQGEIQMRGKYRSSKWHTRFVYCNKGLLGVWKSHEMFTLGFRASGMSSAQARFRLRQTWIEDSPEDKHGRENVISVFDNNRTRVFVFAAKTPEDKRSRPNLSALF